MGDLVPSPVRDRGRQVGYLERSDSDLSLPDGDGDDRGELPATLAVPLVVELGRGYRPSQLCREVASQLVSEAETLDIGVPLVHGVVDALVLLVFEYRLQDVAEITVAGHHDRFFQFQRGPVPVASELVVAEVVAVRAGVCHLCVQRPFLQADQPVDELEHGSGRVGSLDSPVEHGLVGVLEDFRIVLAEVRQHADVDTGARHQRQDLPGLRLDGHEAAHLVVHQPLSILLEVGIDRGHYVVAGNGFLVELSVAVALFYLVAGVAKVDVVAFLTAQVLLAGCLYAGFPGIVSRTVLPGMLVDVVLVDFRDVAQEVAAGIDGVVADASGLALETREIVLQFGELHVGLGLDLLEHHHALVADLPLVLLIFGHLRPDEVGGHLQHAGEHEGVELLDLPGGNQDVIGHLVAHDYLPVAVVDYPPGRVDDVIDHRVVGRVDLVLVVYDLDVEQLRQDDGGHYHQADKQLSASTVGRHRSAG